MSKYEEYVREFHENYEEPKVDGYIVGHSGLTPNAKIHPDRINHDELGGLKGGDFDGYYHVTGEELEEFNSYQGQIDTLEAETEASVNTLSQGIASAREEASTAVSNLRNETTQNIATAVTTLKNETTQDINAARQEAAAAVSNLSTKTTQDINAARLEAASSVSTLREEKNRDISDVRTQTNTAISDIRNDTERKISEISSEVETTQTELNARMSTVEGSQAELEGRQDSLSTRLDTILEGATQDSEILDARVDAQDEVHPNLGHNIRNLHRLVQTVDKTSRDLVAVIHSHLQEQVNDLAGTAISNTAENEALKDRISHWEQKSLEAQEHISEQLAELSLGVIRNAQSVQETAEENQQRALAHKKYADREIANLRENVDTNAYTLIKMAGMLSQTTTGGSDNENPVDWSKSESLAIPEPRCAVVNFTGINAMPTSKTVELDAVMEFWDMAGNYFSKPIKCAAQGTSSMGYIKKNVKFDLLNEDGSEFELKIGDWVPQDGFHLKAYYTDYFRGVAVPSYKFWDEVMRFNGTDKDRPYKIAFGVTKGVTPTGSVIQDTELQLETGALCHPDGFPCIVYLNGEFYGIFSWQIKKQRKNYHMDKSTTEHVHLDGTLSAANFWDGAINWTQFEIRNPNKLYTMNGKKYDGDAPKELIDSTSEYYDPDNKDHKRTAKVKGYIQALTQNFVKLKALYTAYTRNPTPENLAAVKAKYEEIFDVENQRDYMIFSDVVNNRDGFAKNWQWTTYDGVKWWVNAYDLDQSFGGHWQGAFLFPTLTAHITTDTSSPTAYITLLYNTELEAKYAELRDAGIIDTEHILSKLKDWCARIGTANYEREYAKWPESPCIKNYTDSIYRVKKWLETEIANMDAVYHYIPKEQQQQQELKRIDKAVIARQREISHRSKHFYGMFMGLQEQVNELAFLKMDRTLKDSEIEQHLAGIDESIEELLEGGALEYEGAAVARNSETNDMLEDVFNGDGSGGEALSEIPEALKDKVTTAEEFDDMLSEIFG